MVFQTILLMIGNLWFRVTTFFWTLGTTTPTIGRCNSARGTDELGWSPHVKKPFRPTVVHQAKRLQPGGTSEALPPVTKKPPLAPRRGKKPLYMGYIDYYSYDWRDDPADVEMVDVS